MTKLEIINETVEYYTVNPRSVASGQCVYNGPNDTHCAVGRCFRNSIKELGTDFQGNYDGVESLHSDYNGLDKLLEEKYQDHSVDFWGDVQHLHDSEHHWKDGQLSLRGREYVDELRERYGKSEIDEIKALAERFGVHESQITIKRESV